MSDNVTPLAEPCKICRGTDLELFAHTALCRSCGVLLFYPYPKSDGELVSDGEGKSWPVGPLDWYSESSFLNHSNFTDMLRFAADPTLRKKDIKILDYGGGGGQFALVVKSHFPRATVCITDISDESLLDEWRPLNEQIAFKDFATDDTKFDLIFLNDVFEHVSDPQSVLTLLAGKLTDSGRIFIDTPRQFWLFRAARMFSKRLYEKILSGTVSVYHLQIWSRKSFDYVIASSGLKLEKYAETSEYTMPASYYLHNMEVTNPLLRFAGSLFYRNAKYLAKNKIMCVLSKK